MRAALTLRGLDKVAIFKADLWAISYGRVGLNSEIPKIPEIQPTYS